MNQNQRKILAFSKIMIKNDLIPDITQLICETFIKRNISALLIQKSYNEYKYFMDTDDKIVYNDLNIFDKFNQYIDQEDSNFEVTNDIIKYYIW